MLEWMHDESVVVNLRSDFLKKTLSDCINFINLSEIDITNINYAIVSDQDEYMGTVSLKHLDKLNKTAEFAICVRSSAMGKGYSWYGMEEILKIAFDKLDLETIYWCVSKNNKRAVRFYDKHNFHEFVDIPKNISQRYKGIDDLKWYSALKGDVIDKRTSIAGCNVFCIKTISSIGNGELSFFEGQKDIPFDIKRIYYISKVPEGKRRGFHAHKNLKQILFCPYGRIQLILENRNGREEIELSDPSIGVVITEPTWREMLWLQKDSVLCVAASDYYYEDDYIRDHEQFVKEYC